MRIDTLIIGAGQAGLATSYHLNRLGRPHLILEQALEVANSWRNHRWDSFTLVTPNWQLQLPGHTYQGHDNDGYLARDEVVRYLEEYAAKIRAPVQYGVRVLSLEQIGPEYVVHTSAGDFAAANVIVAAGFYQQPKAPDFGVGIPPSIQQLHTSEYRNPMALPAGAVLVVGSGQSGCQIAEELYQSGRKVYLSIGSSSGRAPHTYRGRSTLRWLTEMGFFERTVGMLPSPGAKFSGNPHVTGKGGGHTLNLHQFVRDGVTLLGRIVGGNGAVLEIAPDLMDSLAKVDQFEANLVKAIDDYIVKHALDAPLETLPQLRNGYASPVPATLDMAVAGITTIIWAMGYDSDFSWIKLPLLDGDGYPVQRRGVTDYPGLYFVGLHWQHTAKSDLLFGVGADAEYVAEQLVAMRRP